LVPPRTSRFGIAHSRQVKNHTIMAFMGAHDIPNWRPQTLCHFKAVRHLLTNRLEVRRFSTIDPSLQQSFAAQHVTERWEAILETLMSPT
jgi:hypothetical protein